MVFDLPPVDGVNIFVLEGRERESNQYLAL